MPMFEGALTAMVTPFRNDRLDEPALRALVDSQIAGGIHGLVPCGTTGESVNLSAQEYRRVLDIVVEQTKGRVPVMAGAGTASTRHTIELCEVAKAAGVDGVLIVCPYYNRPTQDGLFAHYSAVAAAAHLPVMLYNIPGRSGVDLSLATLERLAAVKNIIGIKEATGNVARSADILTLFGDRFVVTSGDDALTLPILASGGQGVISVASNVAPAEVANIYNRFKAGDLAGARLQHQKLRPLYEALFVESSPCPVKAALEMLGRMSDELRLPLVTPTEPTRERLRAALDGLGLR